VIHFEEILEKVEAYNPNCDQDLLRRAYVFSAREHSRARCGRSGEPYLVHPLNVASILADMKATTSPSSSACSTTSSRTR
jgi:GTP pyrophosphokinase